MPAPRLARLAGALLAPLLAPSLLLAAIASAPRPEGPDAASAAAGGGGGAPTEHVVRMVLDGGDYRFDPASLTVRPGDRVTFVNESGGPHNVAFDAAAIDDAREAALAAGMPNPMAPLAGPLMTDAGARYTIALDGVAPGRYAFICMPHVAMKMTGSLTVR